MRGSMTTALKKLLPAPLRRMISVRLGPHIGSRSPLADSGFSFGGIRGTRWPAASNLSDFGLFF